MPKTQPPFDPFQTGQYDLLVNQAVDLLNDGMEKLSNEGQRLIEARQFEELRRLIDKATGGIHVQRDLSELKPYSLDDLASDIHKNKEGLKSGWPALDKTVRIPQEAISILAGQPSHGKTTVLLNLFLNCVKEYPKRKFLFYSYEENSKHLALKMLMNLSNTVLDEINNFSRFEELLKHGSNISDIDKAIDELNELTNQRRLWLLDHNPDTGELYNELKYITKDHDVGGIFIDYVQKMRLQEPPPDRQRELQIISNELLRMAKEFRIPIVLGAQLEKNTEALQEGVRLDQLRDCGDIEQDANLIMGVYNKSMEKARTGTKIPDRLIDLKLTVLKNRNGSVNQDVILRFDRPVLKIRDFSDRVMRAPTPGVNLSRL